MRFPVLGKWVEAETGVVLIERLFVAETYWQRLRGLQFARSLAPDAGLLLRDCRSVHTMWMRFAIDLIFLSEDWQIRETRIGVKPWRVVVPRAKNVAHVIEIAAGQDREWFLDGGTRIVPNSESSPIDEITTHE